MNLIEDTKSDKPKYKRWVKEVKANGLTKRVEVEEVSNGFIITISKYGDIDNKYIDETIKKISISNPFEKDKEESDDSPDLMSSANTLDFW